MTVIPSASNACFRWFKTPVVLALALALFTGCAGLKPLKGGHARTSRTAAGGIQQILAQGDNPAQPSRQDQESVKVRTYILPVGTRIEPGLRPAVPGQAAPETVCSLSDSNAPAFSVVLAAPMPVTEREETRARTELGAAQRDKARELGARLASLRGITWAGVGLFVFGLATLVWPPLKTLIGSVTTGVMVTLGGLALIILPTLIVGNELLILGGVTLAVAAWFLAHRHGHLRGQLAAVSPVPILNPNRNLNLNPNLSDPASAPARSEDQTTASV